MTRKLWTPDERKKLKRLYLNHTGEECAKLMNRTLPMIYGRVHAETYRHSRKFQAKLDVLRDSKLIKAGIKSRIKKGGLLPNGTRFVSPKGTWAAGSEKGWFKKGNPPAGTLHDGAIRIRLQKTGHAGKKRMMKFIRIKKGKWIYLKNYVWQKHHGKIPKGMCVAFKNPEDTLNCSIRNLCLLTKAELMEQTKNTDEWIASSLAHTKGKKGSYDRELAKEILKNHTGLIKLKRSELRLRRKLRGKAVL